MISIIKTGGKQYKVSSGDTISVEKLEGAVNDKVTFDEVLLVADEAGEDVKIGTPFLEGTNVTGTIMEQGRSDKITVIKFKAKVRYRRKAGHRQPFTKIKID